MQKYTPKLKIIPLGGLEEIGRNMTIIEYARDIIIIDMGLQFPEEDMPGIDYIIPNIAYLHGKENYIRGILITHGHLDHIGAIPHIMDRIGNPTIFTAKLTKAMIQKRQEEFTKKEKLSIYTISEKDKIQLGQFKVEFFKVNHNIPDGFGIIIHTPFGPIVHTGDFKFDPTPIGDSPANKKKLAAIGRKKVLALMSDSTDSENQGHSVSEKTIMKTLHKTLSETKGRTIIATFSSLITRIQQVIFIAEKLNKKIAIEGFSMKTNVEIAKKLGYLKTNKKVLISTRQAIRLPNKKVIILCTGAQGEESAALMRIANQDHKEIRIEKGDTVIFSSSVIPGNERSVQRLKDSLTRLGADIFHYKMMDVHAGGHGFIDDLTEMITLTKPKYFIPIHGNHYMLKLHSDIAKNTGIIKPENIFIADNGQIMDFQQRNKQTIGELTKRKVPANHVMVDGLGVGDVSNIVLRDRKMMAEDGMFVIILTMNGKTGQLISDPDIISRGFVFMKESKRLIQQTKQKIKKILTDHDPRTSANDTYIRNKVRDQIGQFLFNKTQRRPMILPVIIEV